MTLNSYPGTGVIWSYFDVGGWGTGDQYMMKLGPFSGDHTLTKTGPNNLYYNWFSQPMAVGDVFLPLHASFASGFGASSAATTYAALSWNS